MSGKRTMLRRSSTSACGLEQPAGLGCGSGHAVEQVMTTPSLAARGATTFGALREQTSFDRNYAMADVSSSSPQLFAYATVQFP